MLREAIGRVKTVTDSPGVPPSQLSKLLRGVAWQCVRGECHVSGVPHGRSIPLGHGTPGHTALWSVVCGVFLFFTAQLSA